MPRGRKPKHLSSNIMQFATQNSLQQQQQQQQVRFVQQENQNVPSHPISLPLFSMNTGIKRRYDERGGGNDDEYEYDDDNNGDDDDDGDDDCKDGDERHGKNRRLSANTIVVNRLMEAADLEDAMDEQQQQQNSNLHNIKYDEYNEENNDNDDNFANSIKRLQELGGIPPQLHSSLSSSTQPPLQALPLTSTFTQLTRDPINYGMNQQQQPQLQSQQQQQQQQQQQVTKKSDVSLTKLAQRFIGYMKSKPGLTVDLNDVASALKTSKRRIYDITNVLEGTDFLCKVSKSVVRWKDDASASDSATAATTTAASAPKSQDNAQNVPPATSEKCASSKDYVSDKLAAEAKADGFPLEKLTRQSLVEDIERIKSKIAELDARTAAAKGEKASLINDPTSRSLMYVTEEDLGSVRMLQDTAFVVVCSQYGSHLEVVQDMQNDVFVSASSGSIFVSTYNFRREADDDDDDDSSDSDNCDDVVSNQYGGIGQKTDDFYSLNGW